jgi:hypothetical protein
MEDKWTAYFKADFGFTTPEHVNDRQVAVAAKHLQQAIEQYWTLSLPMENAVQEHEDLIAEISREYRALDKVSQRSKHRKV